MPAHRSHLQEDTKDHRLMSSRIKTFTLKTSSTLTDKLNAVIKLGDGHYFRQIAQNTWERITLLEWVRAIR